MALRIYDLPTQLLGLVGEKLAARYLRRKGWRVLAQRLHTESAEIDLVARDGEQLVCVEVKTGRLPFRASALGGRSPVLRWRPGRRATRRQLARLRRAAGQINAGSARKARVDLIEVLVEMAGNEVRFIHHRDCRQPPKAPPSSP